jgi:uncharacterized Rmd1/YagE family protein
MSTASTCLSISNAKRYSLDKVKTLFPKAQSFEHEKDALLLEIDGGHVLIFGFGCVVFWGISTTARQDILQKINPMRF